MPYLLADYPACLAGHFQIFLFAFRYERTKPIFNYTVDECGPVHIVAGDGGNSERLVTTFIDTEPQLDFCTVGGWVGPDSRVLGVSNNRPVIGGQ